MSRAGSVPPLHGLVAFEAVARHRSRARAAAERGQSRGALRRALRSLEAHVGAALLIDGSPSCELTSAGLAYLPAVRRFLECLNQALPPTAAADETLRIQVDVDAAHTWLLPCLGDDLPGTPAVDVHVEGGVPMSPGNVRPVDVMITAEPSAAQDDAVVGATWTEQLVLVGPRGGEDAADATRRDRDGQLRLIEHRHLDLAAWFRTAGLSPPPTARMRVDNMRSVAAAVCAGLGPGVLCERAAQAGLASGQMLQWAGARHPGRCFRVLLAPQALSRADVRTLLERLRASAQALPSRVPAPRAVAALSPPRSVTIAP